MSASGDPRVLFSAERTLLAWTRTSLTLMAFGFVIERFGLVLRLLVRTKTLPAPQGVSFWLGIGFLLVGIVVALFASVQYHHFVRTLSAQDIPAGYRLYTGVAVNILLALLGLGVVLYLFNGIH